uniref:Ribosome biogenesis protein NOP53 n=1 Tax=Glossina palpalis gambiensis TaxID=67801 RepID=A0A3F2Z4M6_9MUSC
MSLPKRKRVSKKNKSAWRKTDIKDVEDFLEDKLRDERIGTFSEKQNEDIFHIDVIATESKRKLNTEKQKRKLNAIKPMKSWKGLENYSKVEDPIVKRNTVKQKKCGRDIEKEVCNPIRSRHFKANQDRAKYYEKVKERLKKKASGIPDINKDIWTDADFRDNIPGLKDEKGWISRDLSLYIAKNIGKPIIKVHDSIRHRTTKAKNFEPPHPGISYNPSLDDHQKLILKVVEKEENIIKGEKHLERVTTRMFKKVTPEEKEAFHMREMRSGFEDDDNEDTDDDIKNFQSNEDSTYQTSNPPVENKKKSKQARSKELKQKELEKKTLEKKMKKKQTVDINRIKSLKKEILEEEESLNALKKKRKKTALKKKYETKRLGRLKFIEQDEDVNMPEDLAGSMCNIKQESSLLIDRFKSFQKRNMLPVSVAVGKQKTPKVKRFPRSSHKDPGISYQMLREQRIVKKKVS